MVKRQNKAQAEEICRLIGWTQEQYCVHQFEVYEKVLKRRFSGQEDCLLNRAMYSELMSGFFKNEWSKRNQTEFLPFAKEHFHLSPSYVDPNNGLCIAWDYDYQQEMALLADEYMYCHNPCLLINDKAFMARLNYTLNLIFSK